MASAPVVAIGAPPPLPSEKSMPTYAYFSAVEAAARKRSSIPLVCVRSCVVRTS